MNRITAIHSRRGTPVPAHPATERPELIMGLARVATAYRLTVGRQQALANVAVFGEALKDVPSALLAAAFERATARERWPPNAATIREHALTLAERRVSDARLYPVTTAEQAVEVCELAQWIEGEQRERDGQAPFKSCSFAVEGQTLLVLVPRVLWLHPRGRHITRRSIVDDHMGGGLGLLFQKLVDNEMCIKVLDLETKRDLRTLIEETEATQREQFMRREPGEGAA